MEDRGVKQSVIEAVMQNGSKIVSTASPTKKAEWIKAATERLEKLVDKNKFVEIMEKKGRICCGAALRNKAKQFFESALEKSVKVELVQSVITGAESCEFIIHI